MLAGLRNERINAVSNERIVLLYMKQYVSKASKTRVIKYAI